jgi:CRP-like cAMP-binding protein
VAIKRKASFNSKSFLDKVGEGRSIGAYRSNRIVFSQGDPADAVFFLQNGKAKVTVVSEQGKEAVVAILGTNDFFGEGCLTGQALRIATVRTMMECVIVRLEKATIIRVIHEEPAFAEMFIAHLLGRNIRVEADLVDQLFNSSEKRLARLLLLVRCPYGLSFAETQTASATGLRFGSIWQDERRSGGRARNQHPKRLPHPAESQGCGRCTAGHEDSDTSASRRIIGSGNRLRNRLFLASENGP